MSADSIQIVEYNSKWPAMFAAEREFLLNFVGEYLCGTIEHLGSTAVVSLSAKPVIDIMRGVEPLERSKGAIRLLRANCYSPFKVSYGSNDWPLVIVFVKT
jgi:GrpB-like predicted nucleotidyltransferase (UPF0157 family)